jgi:hypothetical protein
MKKIKYTLIFLFVLCLWYTGVRYYERLMDLRWWYDEDTYSSHYNIACPAHPEWSFDWWRLEIKLHSVNNDPNCDPWKDF